MNRICNKCKLDPICGKQQTLENLHRSANECIGYFSVSISCNFFKYVGIDVVLEKIEKELDKIGEKDNETESE